MIDSYMNRETVPDSAALQKEKKMKYYKRIYFLKKIIIKLGWTVELYSIDLPHIGGRIFYGKRMIKINDSDVFFAYITICHEFGHLIYWYFWRNFKKPKKERRELVANILGWLISNILLSKISWNQFIFEEDIRCRI